jgi:RNA polymerase sigma factor (sigma-70 family)
VPAAGTSDALIIEASLEEPDRFEAIFDRHYETIRRYAQRRLGADVGEEVASETFVEAFAHRARFEHDFSSARPWLLGIATNLIRHHARAERVHWNALKRVPWELEEDDASDVGGLDAQRRGPEIVAALEKLTSEDRDVFLLFALADLTYAEVAQAARIPVGTVRSRIHRVRRTLRELLGAEEAINLQYAERNEVF